MLRKQVYIEAQLIDVQLSDNFSFGVNWNLLRKPPGRHLRHQPAVAGLQHHHLPARQQRPGQHQPDHSGRHHRLVHRRRPGRGLPGQERERGGQCAGGLRQCAGAVQPQCAGAQRHPGHHGRGQQHPLCLQQQLDPGGPGGGASTSTSSVQTDSVFSGILVGVMPFMREDGRAERDQPHADRLPTRAAWPGHGQCQQPGHAAGGQLRGITTTLNVGDGDVVLVGGLIDQHSSTLRRARHHRHAAAGQDPGPDRQDPFRRELVIVMRVHVL
jgi:general secretion pathway protein D